MRLKTGECSQFSVLHGAMQKTNEPENVFDNRKFPDLDPNPDSGILNPDPDPDCRQYLNDWSLDHAPP